MYDGGIPNPEEWNTEPDPEEVKLYTDKDGNVDFAGLFTLWAVRVLLALLIVIVGAGLIYLLLKIIGK